MKPTSEILERIAKSSKEHKDGVFTRLYRYLLREDIYYAAYQKLYANKGATTKGVDDDTADGFSDVYVKKLIVELKDGIYRAKPVRREYIPKKNGKKCPFGITSFRDKLLQEAVRMILEAIYEPVFHDHSHGFRPNKSCHTALRQNSSDFTGVVWFIEGDITGCFDNIDHEILVDILARKIKDGKFLNIIRQFLKAGYVENWKYNKTYSGAPQGGICSPILANIYLNELDQKFEEIKGYKMKNGKWRKSRSLQLKVALTIPHTEKIEKFMFAKKAIIQKDGKFKPVHRTALLNQSDSEIVEQYNAEMRGLLNYYNLAVDYHTLDYFCYLMEYSCLKTIANKHKSSVRKIIRKYKDKKTWSVPYETKEGTKRVRPVKIADCKRGEASDIVFQRTKFNWKSTIRQRLNAGVCELCGKKDADLYEVHVVRNLNELRNSDWELAMKAKRRKTLVVCSDCHKRIHS